MRLTVLALLALQAATPAQEKRVAWVPNPRVTGGWVSDPSHHLKQSTVQTLNGMASSLERETTDELAVVVVDSTSGLETSDFALAVHRAWGVGKGTRDNGIVVLWVPPKRAVYVSVGYGLEGRLIDGRVGRIRDEKFFPAFKAGHFDQGMLAGVSALIAAAREEGTPTARIKERASRLETVAGTDKPVYQLTAGLVAFVLAVLALSIWYRTSFRRRHHTCPKCRQRMRYLTEPRERLAALNAGQRAEERLRSVHYDAWRCPSCQMSDVVAHDARLTSVRKCPQCHFRTLQRNRITLAAATYDHGGQDLLRVRCAECGYTQDQMLTTPRLAEQSSYVSWSDDSLRSDSGSAGGSSGGDDSFGGGSAGGGGAGGTY